MAQYFIFSAIYIQKIPLLIGKISIRGQNGTIYFNGHTRTKILGNISIVFDDPKVKGEIIFNSGITIEDNVIFGARSGAISIGNNSFIGSSVIIQSYKNADIFIGNNVLIAAKTSIFSTNHLISDPMKGYFGESGKTIHIHDNVWIGANSVITSGVVIGEYSIVGAGSVVTKDIPACSMVAGNPAKVIKQYDSILQAWVKK